MQMASPRGTRRSRPKTLGGPVLRVRCPKCGKRLTTVEAVQNNQGAVQYLRDLAVPMYEVTPEEAEREGSPIVGLAIHDGRTGTYTVGRALRPELASDIQPGPVTGYHESQQRPEIDLDNVIQEGGRLDFGPPPPPPPPWTWNCPCGARPRVSRDRLHMLAETAVRGGQKDINL